MYYSVVTLGDSWVLFHVSVLQTEGLYDPDYVPYDVELSLYGNQSTMNPTLTGELKNDRMVLS